ncbi:hypothetical protein N2152v2_008450 [Parachlorella kessleri]
MKTNIAVAVTCLAALVAVATGVNGLGGGQEIGDFSGPGNSQGSSNSQGASDVQLGYPELDGLIRHSPFNAGNSGNSPFNDHASNVPVVPVPVPVVIVTKKKAAPTIPFCTGAVYQSCCLAVYPQITADAEGKTVIPATCSTIVYWKHLPFTKEYSLVAYPPLTWKLTTPGFHDEICVCPPPPPPSPPQQAVVVSPPVTVAKKAVKHHPLVDWAITHKKYEHPELP